MLKRVVYLAAAICLLLTAIAVFTSTCSGGDEVGKSKAPMSVDSGGKAGIEVKPLNDKKSPYIGQYAEWDLWVYEHAIGSLLAFKQEEMPADWEVLTAYVNSDGYMIPMLEYAKLREEAEGNNTFREFKDSIYTLHGAGVIDKALRDRYFDEVDKIRARYFPLIPNWVASSPPRAAMLLPNGDVLTHGPLGEGGDKNEPCCGDYDYFRYNSNGDQVGDSKRGVWWLLYLDTNSYPMPAGDFEFRKDGYILFKDPMTGDVLSLWDYNGTRLDERLTPPPRDCHYFTWLPVTLIRRFSVIQKEVGSLMPTAESSASSAEPTNTEVN